MSESLKALPGFLFLDDSRSVEKRIFGDFINRFVSSDSRSNGFRRRRTINYDHSARSQRDCPPEITNHWDQDIGKLVPDLPEVGFAGRFAVVVLTIDLPFSPSILKPNRRDGHPIRGDVPRIPFTSSTVLTGRQKRWKRLRFSNGNHPPETASLIVLYMYRRSRHHLYFIPSPVQKRCGITRLPSKQPILRTIQKRLSPLRPPGGSRIGDVIRIWSTSLCLLRWTITVLFPLSASLLGRPANTRISCGNEVLWFGSIHYV